ncbi:hypothetical protein [Actinoplanes sp. NPDC026619]|uniref:NACHT domain-containing protein n=1 Tax=Actinoplanes sp. NPDC026619 TaxID=3155798 RepID=UPI0033E1565C
MPKGLSYLDAVKILGGPGPLAKTVDNLLGGLLSVATAGGSEAALSFFDAKAEMVRLGALVTTKIADIVRGTGRYNRSERLLAASGVLVVAALFEALDDGIRAVGLDPAEFTVDEQLLLIRATEGDHLLDRLVSSPIPLPSPVKSYADLLDEIGEWCGVRSAELAYHLPGLAFWDDADETARRRAAEMVGRLGELAVARYDELHRRLAAEIPEFAIWSGSLEARATAQSLRRLESLLVRASAGRDPGRHRAALSRAYQDRLNRPVLAGDAGDLTLPDLGDAYLDPLFKVKVSAPGARPADETWWERATVRDDFHDFLAVHLTTTAAAENPLLLLGQPGAGKSSLTHILAARLPANDYLVARVPLREVPAEAEIQDQIELAVRAAVGETVAWAEMAEDAGRPLAVVLLDGFDELLQTTGVHQSDYLQRVAAFQERELAQGRPVAVIVTSRVVVADKARIPLGSLIVRLEPFTGRQIERWLQVWNRANPSAEPLLTPALTRLPDLAGQPLLLLMLALYHASGSRLSEDFDTAQLYERLLSEFAAREVRRVHAGRPESAMPELIEAELLRLSVVAFAMFHRNRLWVTERELDDDLAGLGTAPAPARPGGADGFRTSLTAGQEMIGRFFFIQRAQAIRDDRTLQTYEFLHATFGEYLVARLTVQALRDTTAREGAATLPLRFGREPESDLVQDLLGYTPLTARNTVLLFVRSLLDGPDRDDIRDFLVRRTRQAVTRPQYTPGRYRPVDKRVDHWMATYSLNLVFLTLACGGELRATDLFTEAADPADWLRGSALQWRAALPGGMWLDALESITARREMRDRRRDIVLTLGAAGSLPTVDPAWSNRLYRIDRDGGSGFFANFDWYPAMTSMHLSNNLSDDTLLQAMEPMLTSFPHLAGYHVVHESGRTESVAHSLMRVWMAAGFAPADLTDAYRNAVDVLLRCDTLDDSWRVARMLLRSLRNDAARLDPDFVLTMVKLISAGPETNDAVLADAIHTLLARELADAGPARREALYAIFTDLVERLGDLGRLRQVMDSLEESGDLAAVLAAVRDALGPAAARSLANEVRESHPHLAHQLR